MVTGYLMDSKVVSSLLKKMDNISLSWFNHNIHNQLSLVKKIDTKYALKDPKLLYVYIGYATLDSIGLCGFVHAEYSTIFSEQDWTALNSSISSANNSSIPIEYGKEGNEASVNSGGRICFACGSKAHLRENPECPKYDPAKYGSNKKKKPDANASTSEDIDHKKQTPRPKAAWKYLHTPDKNQAITD